VLGFLLSFEQRKCGSARRRHAAATEMPEGFRRRANSVRMSHLLGGEGRVAVAGEAWRSVAERGEALCDSFQSSQLCKPIKRCARRSSGHLMVKAASGSPLQRHCLSGTASVAPLQKCNSVTNTHT